MPATAIELKRHYHTLSEQETEEVIEGVAELIVYFLKAKRDPERVPKHSQERGHEPDAATDHESR